MRNEQYEEYYDKQFINGYNKYEVKKNDEITDIPHSYSIPIDKREILHHLEVYTIDPEDCEDADDAFSIAMNRKTNKLYLYIHNLYNQHYSILNPQICKNLRDTPLGKKFLTLYLNHPY